MQKAKKISWKDTNMALVGSDIDKKCREAAAGGSNISGIILPLPASPSPPLSP
jgi:hypothetical protein